MLESFTIDTFTSRLGEEFRLRIAGDDQLTTHLVSADASAGDGVPGGRIPFSLVLRADSGRLVPQGTYRVHNAGLGEFDLFLVPIGPDAHGMRYEAVFS